jgi:enoyl-[acyl-carrier protein] reductase III
MDLRGQVALVTGSSRGIGRAVALGLAEAGASVAVNYRRSEEAAWEVAREIEARGAKALPVKADLENEQEIREMFQTVRQTFGSLDILVANAAATAFKPLLEVKAHHIDRTFRITVHGFLACVREAVELMEGRRGKVVAISGADAHQVMPGHGILAAAKAALEALVRYLACELAERGISVNGVCPGVVETDSARVYAGDRWASTMGPVIDATPWRRLGTPEDIAPVIVFLCSPPAAWITGQTLMVDGGLSLTSPLAPL